MLITKKIIIGGTCKVYFKDGTNISTTGLSEEQVESALKAEDKETICSILFPEIKDAVEKNKEALSIKERVQKNSKLLTIKGDNVYLKEISDTLTMPLTFLEKFLAAEIENNSGLIMAYTNFWKFLCNNPDPEVIKNLFWFIDKYNITILPNGLFVAYRNANMKYSPLPPAIKDKIKALYIEVWDADYGVFEEDVDELYVRISKKGNIKLSTKKREDREYLGTLAEVHKRFEDGLEGTVLTDARTGTFNIILGNLVQMPREDCDSSQDRTCSTGLHVASKGWLESQGTTYFGNTSLICLINPANTVSVPPQDSYGKMRVCSYLPVAVAERDEEGHIIEELPDNVLDYIINTTELDPNNEEHPDYELFKTIAITLPGEQGPTYDIEDVRASIAKKNKVC